MKFDMQSGVSGKYRRMIEKQQEIERDFFTLIIEGAGCGAEHCDGSSDVTYRRAGIVGLGNLRKVGNRDVPPIKIAEVDFNLNILRDRILDLRVVNDEAYISLEHRIQTENSSVIDQAFFVLFPRVCDFLRQWALLPNLTRRLGNIDQQRLLLRPRCTLEFFLQRRDRFVNL